MHTHTHTRARTLRSLGAATARPGSSSSACTSARCCPRVHSPAMAPHIASATTRTRPCAARPYLCVRVAMEGAKSLGHGPAHRWAQPRRPKPTEAPEQQGDSCSKGKHTHIPSHLHTFTLTHTRQYAHTHANTRVHAHSHTQHTPIFTHTCTYTHTHKYAHTPAHPCSSAWPTSGFAPTPPTACPACAARAPVGSTGSVSGLCRGADGKCGCGYAHQWAKVGQGPVDVGVSTSRQRLGKDQGECNGSGAWDGGLMGACAQVLPRQTRALPLWIVPVD